MSGGRLTRIGTGAPASVPPERTRLLVKGSIAPHFVDAHALSREDAIAFTPTDARERRTLAAMVRDGSIRLASDGRCWFDMAAYEAAARVRARRWLPWLVVVPVLIAVLATTFYRNGSVSRW